MQRVYALKGPTSQTMFVSVVLGSVLERPCPKAVGASDSPKGRIGVIPTIPRGRVITATSSGTDSCTRLLVQQEIGVRHGPFHVLHPARQGGL